MATRTRTRTTSKLKSTATFKVVTFFSIVTLIGMSIPGEYRWIVTIVALSLAALYVAKH